MNYHTISTIARREVRDTLSDWRIVLPIVLLTFIMPQLLVGGARLVVRFIEDEGLAGRLVPFAALLVGFIPSSFSLITALESFVGERERNSLESLLALPVNDNELYVGKLVSSLLTPLLSSLGAMLIFTFLLYLIDPALYFAAMTLPRLLQIITLITLMGLTMVAGAVVISSHISSIKAANLMSSFILLPMALIVQLAAFLIINDRWADLWLIVAGLALTATLLVRAGMATFNREEILAREQQQPAWLQRLANLQHQVRQSAAATDHRPAQTAHPTRIIALRELKDIVTDWRVLIPVFVLTFIVPWGLIAGLDFAITFVGDSVLIVRLLPFATLLVGFVPASFSLITALESFVGERERNSLEALLALPISDRQLYISKLSSSLMVPLCTSFVAMGVFLVSLAAWYPQLLFAVITPVRLLQLFFMIAAITLVMVAGAVIISSHTSSTRAANLLASFVLIPTSVLLQVQALLIIAARWDVLWTIIAALTVIAAALIRTGLAAFNREEILAREHEQLNLRRVAAHFQTFFHEYQPAGVPPDLYRGLPLSPLRFYRHELPALLRELRLPLLVACIAVVGGALIGAYLGQTFEIARMTGLVERVGQTPPPSPGLAMLIFANNLRVSIFSNLFSSFSFGLFAFLVPAVAFAQVGFVASALTADGGNWLTLGPDSPLQFLLAYVVPHGIIELPTFVLSAALGLRIGAALLMPLPGFSVGMNMLWALANFLRVWLLLLLPLIFAAAMVEGLISPLVIRALYM